jgi:NAD(P)-dependent dehydrogenase (short-subunit alcohol dehydrogenase family)
MFLFSSFFRSNIKGVIYGLRYAIPAIKATVGETGQGSVVVNSSCMGSDVIAPKSAGSSIYAASKAAVNVLVMTAAIENSPTVRVNAVLPGVVQTSIMPVDHDTYQKIGASMAPLYGRPGQPDEIASLVSYLLSSEASFISGSLFKADGLWSLSGGSFGG